MPVITEATWIQEYIYQKYNNFPWLVRNGIRKDIYTMDGEAIAPREQGRFRVLVEGPVDVEYKNVPSSIRLAQESGADEIWLLTSSAVEQYEGVDRVFPQVPIHETPAVYRSCDLLLKLSYVEGMFGPPLEIFHCGGTALVYDVTGHDEYIDHDRNSYVVARDDEEEVVRLLRHLKETPGELERLKQGAAQTAASWPDWEECSDAFEKALLAIADRRPASRDYFRLRTEELFDETQPFLKSRTRDDFAEREKAVRDGKETDKSNFAEFYWDGNGDFNQENTKWHHYVSEEWATVSFEVRAKEIPLWLRLDPSIRIGIIEIDSITVRNKTRDTEIMAFREADAFQTLFLAGDLKWIIPERKNIVFAYGRDPIIVLPAVEEGRAEVGDVITVTIRLKERGVQQFFEELQQETARSQVESLPECQPVVWWKRIFRGCCP
jgi:hypothetical protein